MNIIKVLGNEKCYLYDNGDKVPFDEVDQYVLDYKAKQISNEVLKSKPKKRRRSKKENNDDLLGDRYV